MEPSLIRLALHGGAGDLTPGHPDPAQHRAELARIAADGLRMLREGASALDTVESVVMALEDCPLFNAGVGAVLNRDGMPELDASIMDGRTREAGAVASVSRIRNPVKLARAVMEKSPHVLFAGPGAEALGRELNLPMVTPDHFVTEERFRQLKAAHARGAIVLDHDAAFEETDSAAFGTVGAVARDGNGHLAAATSTGGLTNKHPGRIGDSPLIGAGTFADDASVAVSCTGTGESFIRACFGHDVHARIAYSGWELGRACMVGLGQVKRYGGRGGCIAIGADGALATPFNSRVMFRAWVGKDGVVKVGVGPQDGHP